MANPYILLALLIGAIGLFGSGISIGYKWSERSHAADVVAAQNAAIERANKDAEAEKQRALAAAKAEADARLKASQARAKGEIDAARKANPLCNRDADSHGLLVDSIRIANGQKDAPSVVFKPVRPDAGTRKWFGLGHSDVGVPGSGSIRGVPETAR